MPCRIVSGTECIRKARELCPDVPALIITGYAEADTIGDRPDGVEMLLKPFTPAALEGAIARMVEAAAPAGRFRCCINSEAVLRSDEPCNLGCRRGGFERQRCEEVQTRNAQFDAPVRGEIRKAQICNLKTGLTICRAVVTTTAP